MRKKYGIITGLLLVTLLIGLILDSKHVVADVRDCVEMCSAVLIPALFPFMVFSALTSNVAHAFPLKALCKVLNIPEGSGYIFLIGILGGYPTGAQCIVQAFDTGTINRTTAQRMLSFCCNAGPAFIFGIGMSIFGNLRLCFVVWFIHLLSAVSVAFLMPRRKYTAPVTPPESSVTLYDAVQRSIRSMASVCAWVIIMCVISGFLKRWVLWMLSPAVRDFLIGLLEISSGSSFLIGSQRKGLAFLVFSVYLAFGGVCVLFQTVHCVAGKFEWKSYLRGKLMQAAICTLLSMAAAPLLFVQFYFGQWLAVSIICIAICATCIILENKNKKGVENTPKIMYNQGNTVGGLP